MWCQAKSESTRSCAADCWSMGAALPPLMTPPRRAMSAKMAGASPAISSGTLWSRRSRRWTSAMRDSSSARTVQNCAFTSRAATQPAGDRKAPLGEARAREMRGVADRAPVEHALGHVGHVGQRADQHRYFIVMIEIVGRQSGDRIDVGRAQPVWILEGCRGHAREGR